MHFRAALLALLTVISVVGTYAVASFQLAYPEGGASGWLLVAAIFVVWAIVCGFILRVWGQR
jgi:hypothetical protein